MVTKEDLISLAKYLSIIHHSKNRIRLRVNPSIKKEESNLDTNMIDLLPKQIDGIKDIKINKLIGSITINYDANIFNPNVWEELVAGNISEELMQKLQNLIKDV